MIIYATLYISLRVENNLSIEQFFRKIIHKRTTIIQKRVIPFIDNLWLRILVLFFKRISIMESICDSSLFHLYYESDWPTCFHHLQFLLPNLKNYKQPTTDRPNTFLCKSVNMFTMSFFHFVNHPSLAEKFTLPLSDWLKCKAFSWLTGPFKETHYVFVE